MAGPCVEVLPPHAGCRHQWCRLGCKAGCKSVMLRCRLQPEAEWVQARLGCKAGSKAAGLQAEVQATGRPAARVQAASCRLRGAKRGGAQCNARNRCVVAF